ncbi:MAG: phosphotransferase [Lentimicrobium sp.]|nr:phosphotransferase [Lentimicrobium sp.]
MKEPIDILKQLFLEWSGEEAATVEALPASGSDRSYFRIFSKNKQAIGAWNTNLSENNAFIGFSKHFTDAGLPVPEVYNASNDSRAYLQSDLGDTTLFGLLTAEGLTENVKDLYRQVVKWLPVFQIKGAEGLDFSVCYPRSAFDLQSMMWDLNYFKYYFARLSGKEFDEQALEDDFNRLTHFLLQANSTFFLYRDFQSRNIMIADNKPYFIDFQGGRQGPLQYDIASLLFDAKANLPFDFREELLELYTDEVGKISETNANEFRRYYYGFVLIRILQALGAYGFRGFYQKKEHFLQSIPYALDNIEYLIHHHPIEIKIPELEKLLLSFTSSEHLRAYAKPGLKVRVHSFSYKHGIPDDESGNGGGFVFDCRALPNPGRFAEYQSLNGTDEVVKTYLSAHSETGIFLASVYSIVDQAVENYISRGFEHLMVSFGCTGGQHRSVYCAEQLAIHLNKRYRLDIKPQHNRREFWAK